MIDLTKLRAILAFAQSPTEWVEVDARTLADIANEIEAARAVVEAAGIHVREGGMRNAQKLLDALAAYRAKVGGTGNAR